MDAAALDQLRIVLDPAGQAGVALALFLLVFSVALGLRLADFLILRDRPLQFLGGVAAQTVGLPLLTLLLVMLLRPPPSIALGMIVVACCPGGASSNFLTYLARGNVAYSVSLTAASSMIAAFFTPLSILLWSRFYEPTASLLRSIDVDAGAFLLQTTILLAAPLVLGMGLAHWRPGFAEAIRRRAGQAGALMLGGVIVYGTIQFFPILIGAAGLITPIVVLHNGSAFALGALAGRLMGADRATRRALTFEVGIQNSGLALVILLSQLQGLGGAAAIAAVWGVWHLIAGGIIVLLFRRLDRREGSA
ncbi:MAG: bile acid:sodium symporter [Pseudomonadota bacterium]|nr:bile acid:sodium symporter [Pseudomonadota bacterium]